MKHFTTVRDVSDVTALAKLALSYKQKPPSTQFDGKKIRVGLLFLNPSLRTRVSTQIAASNLGMDCVVLNVDKDGYSLEFAEGAVMNGSKPEHIREAAAVLGQYFNVLCIRSFPSISDKDGDYSETFLQQFVKYSGIPIISMESCTLHPLQSLADLVTIIEHWNKRRKPKVVLTWAPHIKPLPQAVANSFAEWMIGWGEAELVITQPKGFELADKFTNGASICYDQKEAIAGADFVYVKNWSSYHNYGAMAKDCDEWMLTGEDIQLTNEARVMHCLPVRRNVELSDEVLDSENSLVIEQAANRVWSAQAVLASIAKEIR